MRDIAFIAQLDENRISDPHLLQPIDTWLDQTLRIVFEEEVPTELQKKQASIFKLCKESDISPISFNQGAWVLGSQIAGEFEAFKKILIEGDINIIKKYVTEKERYLVEVRNMLDHLSYQA